MWSPSSANAWTLPRPELSRLFVPQAVEPLSHLAPPPAVVRQVDELVRVLVEVVELVVVVLEGGVHVDLLRGAATAAPCGRSSLRRRSSGRTCSARRTPRAWRIGAGRSSRTKPSPAPGGPRPAPVSTARATTAAGPDQRATGHRHRRAKRPSAPGRHACRVRRSWCPAT